MTPVSEDLQLQVVETDATYRLVENQRLIQVGRYECSIGPWRAHGAEAWEGGSQLLLTVMNLPRAVVIASERNRMTRTRVSVRTRFGELVAAPATEHSMNLVAVSIIQCGEWDFSGGEGWLEGMTRPSRRIVLDTLDRVMELQNWSGKLNGAVYGRHTSGLNAGLFPAFRQCVHSKSCTTTYSLLRGTLADIHQSNDTDFYFDPRFLR